MIIGDLFMQDDQYDLIIEQTLFCAIDPKLRPEYARKCADLLTEKGKHISQRFVII